MSDRIKIAAVENDENYRNFIKETVDQIEFVESLTLYESAEVFWRTGLESPPDLLLIDIHLGGMSGIDLASMVTIKHPDIQKIILTSLDSEQAIYDALRYGCLGYVLKSELESLEKVIRIVHEGGAFITPTIALRVMKSFQIKTDSEIAEKLTEREMQILDQLVSGSSPAKISSLLDISVHTVRFHVKNIYKKLGVNSRPEMMKRAHDLGLF